MARYEDPFFYGPAFGWRYEPAQIEWVLSTLPEVTRFSSACMGDLYETGETDIFFWELEQKLLGNLLPTWNQGKLGSCVSHGSGRAAQDSLLVGIATGTRYAWEGHEVAREPIYGGSRVNVGGQRGSYEAGSVGGWAAKWLNEVGGLILCEARL